MQLSLLNFSFIRNIEDVNWKKPKSNVVASKANILFFLYVYVKDQEVHFVCFDSIKVLMKNPHLEDVLA